MAKINILDSSVFNRIAAGEVVESPHSVVKELVENSIDAGATEITVEVRGGGIDFIAVSDNGKGIEKDEMTTAFLPHATSKIHSLEDLNAILTMGFRGEALPSIASVSQVTMISRRACDSTGYSVTYEDGQLIAWGEVGAACGTTVRVRNLFQNIPVRRKFLKKPGAEAARITDLMEKLILANPSVSIIYLLDGKAIFRHDGSGVESAVYTIYDSEIENFIPIIGTASHITIKGYVIKPLFARHNRKDQTLIVNGRVVENEEVGYGIFLAYKDFLMTRRYPAFILYLDIPHDLVDINVHPNKTAIKFVDAVSVKKFIYNTIRRAITLQNDNIFLASNEIAATTAFSENPLPEEKNCVNPQSGLDRKLTPDEYPRTVVATIFPSAAILKEPPRENIADRQKLILRIEEGEYPQTWEKEPKPVPITQTEDATTIGECSVRVIGKLFETYVIIQAERDAVYLIDQHAAHERILYDRFIATIDNGIPAVQTLLVPFVFSVTHSETEYLNSIQEEIQSIGFSLREYGENLFALSAVPVVCAEMNIKTFVSDILSNPYKAIKKSEFIKEKIAQFACKSAVKAGDDLSNGEILSLLDQMRTNESVPLCPHGRPTFIRLTKTEIEKWFKRVPS